MVANLCLITCAFFTAQPAERSEWLLFARLSQGQELVYRGSYAEASLGRDVQLSRSYGLESRIFVLDTSSRSIDAAVYTVFRAPASASEKQTEIAPTSARLELIKLNPQGRVSIGQVWQVAEDNRPPRIWKVMGMETVGNSNCIRLEAVQQTADWDQPRSDRSAWRRRDTVWLTPALGVASKFERTMERKDLRDLVQRVVVHYELQSNIQYPGRLFEDRRREILQARSFNAALAPLLPNPARYPARTYDAMLAKINHHLDSEPRTPYREAVLQVKRRVEAARRSETPAAANDEIVMSTFQVGQAAPDFVTTNLLTRESVRLRRFLGRPVVMIFYSPGSTKAGEVLRFAQNVFASRAGSVHVVGFAISDDAARVQQQCKDFQLTLPILSGKGLRQSYAVDATPKFVLLDGDGAVRASYDGWGPETAGSIMQQIAASLMKRSGPALERGGQ